MYKFKTIDFKLLARLNPFQVAFLQEGLHKYESDKAKAYRRRGARRGRR